METYWIAEPIGTTESSRIVLRRCKRDGSRYRLSATLGSRQELDFVTGNNITPAEIVRRMKHYSGNPFVDSVFDPGPAYLITDQEAQRLMRVNRQRSDSARLQFERNRVAVFVNSAPIYDSLSPDEQAAIRRASGGVYE